MSRHMMLTAKKQAMGTPKNRSSMGGMTAAVRVEAATTIALKRIASISVKTMGAMTDWRQCMTLLSSPQRQEST